MSFSATPARSAETDVVAPGSKDGRGCGDNDQPYTFGRRPRAAAPFPFTPRQFGRLLALRGRIRDGLIGPDDVDAAGIELAHADQAPTSSSSLCYTCSACGSMVPGAFGTVPSVACARCAQDGGRDGVARALLLTAGVLDEAR